MKPGERTADGHIPSRAVVVGAGDGSVPWRLARQGTSVVVLAFHGEELANLPGHVCVLDRVEPNASIPFVLRAAFGSNDAVLRLPDTTFHDDHEIDSSLAEVRPSFAAEFYRQLANLPFAQGDDVIDGLQGAFHVAHAARFLMPAPTPREWLPFRLQVPAIAIASGPSLARHIDALRALQNKAILIACDTALEGLLRAGITPHFVTPFERVTEVTDESFPRDAYPGVIFAGNPLVDHRIPAKFAKHLLLPGADAVFAWAGVDQECAMSFGQSTGTLAVALAMQLTAGPIYLVGHDLSFAGAASHWGDVAPSVVLTEAERFTVLGNDGGQVETQYWWDIFRREIEAFAHGRPGIINTNGADRVGARIAFTEDGRLPDPAALPLLDLPPFPEPERDRLRLFRDRIAPLYADVQTLIAKVERLSDPQPEDLMLPKLMGEKHNRLLVAYLLRSVFAYFSMESHAGRSRSAVSRGLQRAMVNALEEIQPMLRSMAACA